MVFIGCITNEDVLQRMQERKILGLIQRKKVYGIGHTVRSNGILRKVLVGKLEDARGRGKRKIPDSLAGRGAYARTKVICTRMNLEDTLKAAI